LRTDATNELIAILTYRRFLGESRQHETRHVLEHVINVEIGHFVELMKMIACLDPVQAEEFKRHDLSRILYRTAAPSGPMPSIPGSNMRGRASGDTPPLLADGLTLPHLHDIAAAADDIDRLDMSIEEELTAINGYQEHIEAAMHEQVKTLFAGIMNSEKDHVAMFLEAAFMIAHEHHHE
jgi:rubrerythrin